MTNRNPLRGLVPVTTVAEIAQIAPSVFATGPAPNVSPRYHFANTREILDAVVAEGWIPSGVQETRTRSDSPNYGFAKHIVRFRAVDSVGKEVRVGEIAPELLLINSHDGASSFQFRAGLFRFVCTNGLVVADSSFASLRINHSSKELDRISESARMILDGIPLILNRVDSMKAREMKEPETAEFVSRALALRFEKDDFATDVAFQIDGAKRTEDADPTLWNVFNRVQENLTHGFAYTNADGKTRRVRAVRGVNPSLKLNTGLWSIADEFLSRN